MSQGHEPAAAGSDGQPVIGRAAAVWWLLAACLLFGALLGVLGAWGMGARWRASESVEVYWVDRTADLPKTWESAGARNAVLVDVSQALGFQTVPFGVQVVVPNTYPFPDFRYRDAIMEHSDSLNNVWIASQRGVFRRVYHVLPSAVLARRVTEGRSRGYPNIAADGTAITPNNDGYPRVISAVVPRLDETVVLNVDASYFQEGDPDELAQSLRIAGLEYGVLTLNRGLDETATTDSARLRLERFAVLVGADR